MWALDTFLCYIDITRMQEFQTTFPSVFLFVAETGIILNLATDLDIGVYNVVLRVADNQGLSQDNTVQTKVCDCTGTDVSCQGRIAGGTSLPMILGILGGILLLLSESEI